VYKDGKKRVSVSIERRAEMSKRRWAKDGWTIRSIEWRAVNARNGKGGHRERTWPGNGSRCWKTVGYFRMRRWFARFSREKNHRLRYRLSCVSSIVVSNVRERRAIHIAAYGRSIAKSELQMKDIPGWKISSERAAHLRVLLRGYKRLMFLAELASVTRGS